MVDSQDLLKYRKKDFRNFTNPDVMQTILQIPTIPKDTKNVPLIYMKCSQVKNVFPSKYSAFIYTPIVKNCNINGAIENRRNMSDDITYKLYPALQRLIPRFFSVLLIFDDQSSFLVARHIIQGYYKFGGEAKDEDSNVDTHGLLNKEQIKEATKTIVTEKSNGKGAVITMFDFMDTLYIFGGSKTQHYVGRLDKGILSFDHLNKSFFAWQILEAFFEAWNRLSQESQQLFIEKLLGVSNKFSDGYTACAEFEDGKHMIPLPPNCKKRIIMFGLIQNIGPLAKDESFCSDVEESLEFLERVGLPHTQFRVYTEDEFQKQKESLREKRGIEGYVIHHLKQNEDGSSTTLGVEKFKTWYYIVIRVVREFLRNRQKLDPNWKSLLRRRLLKRNKDYMHMPPNMLSEWIVLSEKFVEWFCEKGLSLSSIGFSAENEGMGNVWQSFLRDSDGLTDDIRMSEGERFQRNSDSNKRTLIIFQGIPGLGKTFLAKDLVKTLKQKGLDAVSLEQDQFVEHKDIKNAGFLCLNELRNITRSNSRDIVLLMRNNSDFGQYNKYATIAQRQNWAVHVVSPKDFGKDLRALAVSLFSVRQRELDGEIHSTFHSLSPAKRYAITFAFFCRYTPAIKKGPVTQTSQISWVLPANEGKRLSHKAREFLEKTLEEVSKLSNPFNFKEENLDAIELEKALEFDHIDYHKWRVPTDQTVEEIIKEMDLSSASPIMQINEKERRNVRIAPSMLYTYVPISEIVMNKLVSIAKNVGVDLKNFQKKIKQPHITLIYGDQQGEENRKIWRKCLEMRRDNDVVKVIVNGIAIRERQIVCFTCWIGNQTKQENMLPLVKSGHPHITIAHSNRVFPVESIKLLSDLNGKESKGNKRYFRLKKDVVFESRVEVYYRNK